ncbi:MAG: hypothetical protein LGR52_14780 [Candidatus Thiosymbion ectosymbiont of Robbea hypermnestra]|nr:hypothetical protein [Candidatus Thiosymbion ectosymbiont of Robbea hypermnestra]
MQTESVIRALEDVSFGEFDNLEPVRALVGAESVGIEDLGAFSGDNARGELREFQSLDKLGEAARTAGEKLKACLAIK